MRKIRIGCGVVEMVIDGLEGMKVYAIFAVGL